MVTSERGEGLVSAPGKPVRTIEVSDGRAIVWSSTPDTMRGGATATLISSALVALTVPSVAVIVTRKVKPGWSAAPGVIMSR